MAKVTIELKNSLTDADEFSTAQIDAAGDGGGTIDPSLSSKKNKSGKQSKESSMMNIVAVQIAKTLFNEAVGQYGNITGDVITQQKIQSAVKVGSLVLVAATGGIPGSIMAGVGATLEVARSFFENAKAQKQADFLRIRSGNLNYGGRDTYD